MAARIVGVNLPGKKRAEIGLTYIFGIGKSLANEILAEAKIDKDKLVDDLSSQEIDVLKKIIDNKYKTGGDLKRFVTANIKRLKEIKCYKGTRHEKKLPVRGQRTRTNSRTIRGNARKTMGSGRRPAAKKN